MPKSKTEMMQRLRAQRKKLGIVQYTVWIKDDPTVKSRLKKYVERINKESK